MDTPSWSLIISALPALAAVLKALFPGGDRGLARRLRRVTTAYEAMPDCDGKSQLQETASRLASELAFREDRDARRRVDGAGIGAVVIIVLVAGGLTSWLWSTGIGFWRWVAGGVALFAVLLILAGATQSLIRVDDHFAFERETRGDRDGS